MSVTAIALRPLAAYGALRLPLALLELPMFVLLPALYHQTHGLSLGVVGAVLFANPVLIMLSFCLAAFGIYGALAVFWTLPTAILRGILGSMSGKR